MFKNTSKLYSSRDSSGLNSRCRSSQAAAAGAAEASGAALPRPARGGQPTPEERSIRDGLSMAMHVICGGVKRALANKVLNCTITVHSLLEKIHTSM